MAGVSEACHDEDGVADEIAGEASESPILSMACSADTKTIAVGTELQNHTASIFLWYVMTSI